MNKRNTVCSLPTDPSKVASFIQGQRKQKKVKKKKPVRYRYVDYLTYIKSDAWKRKKKNFLRALRKAKIPQACYTCDTKYNLHVHHVSYAHIGSEQMRELLLLCTSCHMDLHAEQIGNDVTGATITFLQHNGKPYSEYRSKKNSSRRDKNR